MKKKLNLMTAMILALVLTMSLAPSVAAVDTVDLETKCGITVKLQRQNGNPVANVDVTLHQVGVGRIENSNLYFDLDADLGTEIKLDGLTAEENTANAAKLRELINALPETEEDQEPAVPSWTVKSDENGAAKFENMPVGVYLVQSDATSRYRAITPFLVYLPYTNEEGTDWETELEISPKVSVKPSRPQDPEIIIPDPEIPLDPTDPPVEPPVDIPDPNVPLEELPQTGLLQWPVPIMAMAGLLLFALGWVTDRKAKKAD